MKIKFYLPIVAIWLGACNPIQKVELNTEEIVQYGKTEWLIDVKTAFENPYNADEIKLDAIIQSPTGEDALIPCFYSSGKSNSTSTWKARYAPTEPGNYNITFQLSENRQITASSEVESFTVKASDRKGFLKINNPWTFKYDNGEVFRGIGENFCWESRDEDDSKHFKDLHEDKRFNYKNMLTKLNQNGVNFFRTWMIYWNLPVDWKQPQNNNRYASSESDFNESGMKRMDELVELCDSLNMHMMLALESHAGLLGEGWELSNYNVKNGGFANNALEFFSKAESKKQYKNKLRLMVARYSYSPAIGAWEFFNEVDNVKTHGDPDIALPDSVITNWHNEMSSYLKSIDPNKHLITTSISHIEIDGLYDLDNLDFNQRHMYRQTQDIPQEINAFLTQHNKPFVVGEFGYEWDWSQNFNEFAEEMEFDFRVGLWYGLFNPTPILPMTWWWEFFDEKGTIKYFKPVQTLWTEMLKAGDGNIQALVVSVKNKNIITYGVQCNETNFIYLQNSSTKQSKVQFSIAIKPNTTMRSFNTQTGDFEEVQFDIQTDQSIVIRDLALLPKQDVVLIW